MRRVRLALFLAVCLAAPASAHYDHGVGGERLRFEPFPEVEKRPSDTIVTFRAPPVIQVADAALDFSAGITVSAWVFRDSPASAGPVISQVATSPGDGAFALFADGSEGRGFTLRWEDGATVEVSGYTVPANRWVHLAASYDRVKAVVYVDGQPAASADVKDRSIARTHAPIRIGGAGSLETIPFDGGIDDVRVWRRGLSGDEIARTASDGSGSKPDMGWSFDRPSPELKLSGSVSLIDEAGRGRVARFDWRPHVRLDSGRLPEITSRITIAAWVYNRGVQLQGGPIVGRWGLASSERSYVLYSVGGDGFGFRAFWKDGTQNNLTVVQTPTEAWFHYAATYDGRELRIYVNGVPAGRTIAVDKLFAKSSSDTWIGGVGTTTGEFFSGYLYEVGIWPRALSEQELTEMIAGELTPSEEEREWRNLEHPGASDDVFFLKTGVPDPSLDEAASGGLDKYLMDTAGTFTSDKGTLNRLFWLAADHGQITTADALVGLGADPDIRLGWGGHTALHAAVRDRQVEVIQFLVGKGADVNALDTTTGSTPWEWADQLGYPILRSYLLDTAAETNLAAAIEHDLPEKVEQLLQRQDDWDLDAALHRAARLGRTEIIQLLLLEGADPQATRNGKTAHDLAVINSRYEAVDLLAAAEGRTRLVPPNYIDRVLLLEEAVTKREPGRVADLIALDPDLVRSDPQADRTWLQLAVDAGAADIAGLLIDAGASVDRKRNGHTALSWAATSGETAVGRVLVDHGAPLDFFAASGLGYIEHVQAMLAGDPAAPLSLTGSVRRDQERTPLPVPPISRADLISDALYVAARNGHTDVVLYLLRQGGDPDFRAERGGTAVYWAVYGGHLSTVDALLRAGGDPTVPDRYGRNAIQIATRSGNPELKRLLNIKKEGGRSRGR